MTGPARCDVVIFDRIIAVDSAHVFLLSVCDSETYSPQVVFGSVCGLHFKTCQVIKSTIVAEQFGGSNSTRTAPEVGDGL